MDTQLNNIATAVGTYNSLPTSLTSTAAVVNLVSGLTITKVADKQSWADGPLKYTITINNQATAIYGKPIITDILNILLVDFVTGSVTIDGREATASEYTYNSATGILTVNLADIASATSRVITFQVKKKNP